MCSIIHFIVSSVTIVSCKHCSLVLELQLLITFDSNIDISRKEPLQALIKLHSVPKMILFINKHFLICSTSLTWGEVRISALHLALVKLYMCRINKRTHVPRTGLTCAFSIRVNIVVGVHL